MSTIETMNELNNGRDIRNAIQETAWQCASKGSHFDALWHELLEKMLYQWDADVKMDLWVATEVMLRCAGYYYEGDWHDTHPTSNYDLWYKYIDEKNVLLLRSKLLSQKRCIAFIMTIAVFETINYWCWHDSPLTITFDKEVLFDHMKNGRTHIDWDSYTI